MKKTKKAMKPYAKMNATFAKALSDKTKVISDPTRIFVLGMLEEGPQPVKEIIKRVKIEPTLLSHHLAILRNHQLVHGKRNGKEVIYHKVEGNFKVETLIELFK